MPHDPHDRPVGLPRLSLPLLNTHSAHTHTLHPVYGVIRAYSGMCGQHNAVRRLLRLYVLLTCWTRTYRLRWGSCSHTDLYVLRCLFEGSLVCSADKAPQGRVVVVLQEEECGM